MPIELAVGYASNSIPNPYSAAAKHFQVNNHPTLLFHSVLSVLALFVSISSLSLSLSLAPHFPSSSEWQGQDVNVRLGMGSDGESGQAVIAADRSIHLLTQNPIENSLS